MFRSKRAGGLAACGCLVAAVAFAACGSSNSSNGFAPDGGGDDGSLGSDGHGFVDGPTFGTDGSGGPGQNTCDAGCPMGLVCDFGVCEPMQPACVTNADCEDDTYCKGGMCVPYGYGGVTNDTGCHQAVAAGEFAPSVLCEFTQAPNGDPFPDFLDVQATPIVVNFDLASLGPGSVPSIVVPMEVDIPATATTGGSYTENRGILRILKGKDCSLVTNLAGQDLDGDGVVDWVNSPTAPAVGDLNGDGVPDIVTYMGDFTTVAFTRTKSGSWTTLWPKVKATNTNGTVFVSTMDGTNGAKPTASPSSTAVWSGPSIHDLDNDGKPEIIREGYVIDGQTGMLRASPPADYASYSVGIPPVVADLYNDGNAYLTTGAHVWKFVGASNAWVEVASYEGDGGAASAPGWVGVADFNPYDGKKQPELAVATADSTITVYSLDHSVFMGLSVKTPVAPGATSPNGGGGPPTIADYDQDGLPEVGLAGDDYYTVFDPDCQATPRMGGKCADRTHCDFATGGACPDYILWSRQTQDHSSNITGSSVFDFAGDGTPEVVYGDECFARVFSGFDGTVLFSQYHSSCTWIENPVVADVTGDFHSEIVVPSNLACAPIGAAANAGIPCGQLDANGVDSTFVGAQCKTAADCVSGTCDSGYCRCTTSAQCCAANNDAMCIEQGTQCAPPPAGTPGSGNTCRAPHPHGLQGIRVYGDAKDRWVQSRQIWNQHAYAVTNTAENGSIPSTSTWTANWSTAGLNNFRQNVPGEADGNPEGDVTAQAGSFFTCGGGQATFDEPICNRGTAPVAAGVNVGFYVNGMKVCSATTTSAIAVGKCVTASCTWASPPSGKGGEVNVDVVADDGGGTPECDTGNDKGLVTDVFCAMGQ
jgi:hypothetical protein